MAMTKDYVSPFSWAGIKRNPTVVPVIGCILVGCTLATSYTIRLATKNPDVTWNPKKKPHPQNDYEHRNYKLRNVEPFDVTKYEHPRPRY